MTTLTLLFSWLFQSISSREYLSPFNFESAIPFQLCKNEQSKCSWWLIVFHWLSSILCKKQCMPMALPMVTIQIRVRNSWLTFVQWPLAMCDRKLKFHFKILVPKEILLNHSESLPEFNRIFEYILFPEQFHSDFGEFPRVFPRIQLGSFNFSILLRFQDGFLEISLESRDWSFKPSLTYGCRFKVKMSFWEFVEK